MSIQPTVNSAASRYQANSPTESSTTSINNQTTKPSASELSAENRRQLNQTILDNQLSLSLKSDNKAMNLLYRAISDAVEKRMAGQAPQNANDSTEATAETGLNKTYNNEDTSPQATADRIVSFATNFYQAFREQNPELNDEDGLEQFMQEIGKGIDQGFADARDILTGLKKLEGKVADDIDETYNLIQQGLQDFRERMQQPKEQAAAAE
ncbi:DUF5610 domain-containing protein [Rheinheimera texasensis]|uniref:DUF5610 domain-containing protein n=1 Tax=Rheinheimera texasensis TaxID=306205 RepID=UPI00068E3271|nr:DUF5610 domain-containing protein [Rheinheimera texasensis]